MKIIIAMKLTRIHQLASIGKLAFPTCARRHTARRASPWRLAGATWRISVAAAMTFAPAVRADQEWSLLDIVRRYADTMIEHGRDTYGPQKSMLLLSALDRSTLQPLTTQPPAPAGIRKGDRVATSTGPLTGCNPQLDENLLRLLYTLSEITGEPQYRQVADQELSWFFRHARSPETDLLAWGEHLFWDPINDKPDSEHKLLVHEFSRPWVLWDRCYTLVPEESAKFALGLWESQVADHNTGAYDRHADFWHRHPADGMDFPRHGGFFIATWAAAYQHTKNETFLKAIEAVLARFERKRHPKTGFINVVGNDPVSTPASSFSLSLSCATAADQVPEPLSGRLRKFAEREDQLFLSLPHDPKTKGFVLKVKRATGEISTGDRWGDTAYSSAWQSHYGGAPTGMITMMCIQRYEQTQNAKYRDLVIATADGYLNTLPGNDIDSWPMAFGHAISTEITAFRWTGKDIYLSRAHELSRIAVKTFWQDNPLPKASVKTDHYETITGADTLALALLEVYAMEHHLTVRIPSNTIDR